MTEVRTELHLVPVAFGQALEDPLHIQCEFSESNEKSVVLCSQPAIEDVSQLAVIKADIPENLGNEDEPSSGSGTECYTDPLSHKSFDTPDGLSSSSGRTEEMMSDEGSSSDSAEFPGNIFHSTQHKGEEYSAANEVVCGHQLSRSFLKDQVEYLANLAVDQIYPQEQAGEFCDSSIVVPSSVWPSILPEREPDINTAVATAHPMDMNMVTQSIAEVESLTVQDIKEAADTSSGSLVIGTSQCEPTSQVEIFRDVISDQHHFLEKSVDAIGTALNPLVSNMHDDPNNDVKFRTKKKVYDIKSRHIRTTVTKDVPVSNPAKSPEASDGRKVLKHMCQNYRQYADALNYQSSSDFKTMLKQIIGRVPTRRNHSLTWDSLFNTVYHMRNLMEIIGECLEQTDKFTLADHAQDGGKRLREIAESANQAYKLVHGEAQLAT